jgi:hypothetical protein
MLTIKTLKEENNMVKEFKVEEEGQMAAVDMLIGIAATVIVVIILVVLGLAIAGQAYVQVQDDYTDISDANIQASINNANEGVFELADLTVGYMPILVLAVIGGIALTAVLGFLAIRGSTGGSSF